MTKIERTINYTAIEEIQNDQHKMHSVFEDLQDGCKQNSLAFMVYNLAILMTSQLKNKLRFFNVIMANDLKFPLANSFERIRQ